MIPPTIGEDRIVRIIVCQLPPRMIRDRHGVIMLRCNRCGYGWRSYSENPVRCPSCKSTRWDHPATSNVCMRCGTEWEQRGRDRPRFCPGCHSKDWGIEKTVYECPKCGWQREMRSNSREGMCPRCDRYGESRSVANMPDCNNRGISAVEGGKDVTIFYDGRYILRYIADHREMVYLWDNGRLVGAVNFNLWCKNANKHPGTCSDDDLRRMSEEIGSMFSKCAYKAEFLGELYGLTVQEAHVAALEESGMDGISIAMKLDMPFSEVMALKRSASEKMRSSVRGTDMRLDDGDKVDTEVGTKTTDPFADGYAHRV